MLLPVGRLKKLPNCEQRSQRPFRFEGNEACGQLKCLSEYANPIAVEAFSKGGSGRVSILTAKAKATEMSNTTLAPETRLFNRFSLRAMREMLLEADRETKDDGEGRGLVDSEGVPSSQLSIVHEAQILHAPKLYLLHKTAIKSEMDAERC